MKPQPQGTLVSENEHGLNLSMHGLLGNYEADDPVFREAVGRLRVFGTHSVLDRYSSGSLVGLLGCVFIRSVDL